MKVLGISLKNLIHKIVQENIGQAVETITEKVSLRMHTNTLKDITEFQNKLAKEVYAHCEALYARKKCTIKQSPKMTLNEYLGIAEGRSRRRVNFNVMLAIAKKYPIPDNCLWRRLGWSSNIEWVCLTNPQGKLERHFTAKTSTGYSIWMPLMADMLAEDWVRV